MLILEIFAWALGLFGIIGTLLPFLPYDDWWIRDFDYPRMQLTIILGLAVALIVADMTFFHTASHILLGLCLAAMTYQAFRILPYTLIWRNQVKTISPKKIKPEHRVSLLMCNVLQSNPDSHLLIDLIKEKNPDIVLTLESNQRWQDELDPALEEDYPHTVKVPRENRYGMHLYSRFPLRKSVVNHLITEEIPSIYTQFKLTDGQWVNLYCVHPTPPSPTEEKASTGRDAEIALVGKMVRDCGNTKTMVAGDLNDVAWSHSTRLFQRISGLLDPRRGRGFYATFHADYWFLRWPLDHVFHSTDFGLLRLERLRSVNSDHFPMFIELCFHPTMKNVQEPLEEQEGDLEEAEASIEMGRNGEEDLMFA